MAATQPDRPLLPSPSQGGGAGGRGLSGRPTPYILSGAVVRQFRRSRAAVVGLALTLTFVLLALLAPILAPHDPTAFTLGQQLKPPSATNLLGTDELGRDILSRILYGARITLLITLGAVLVSLVVGTLLGVVAGFLGGWSDTLVMRLMDVLLAMPGFLLAIAIIAALGAGTFNVVVAVGVFSIPAFARVARGSTLSVKQQDYVLAARALGGPSAAIMWRHVLPNVTPPLVVQTTLRLATAILTASGLSFLGLGPQPPTPEWGAMLSTGRNMITSSPQLATIPGLAILLVAIGFNLLGDGLRDALDPRMKR
ncbi:MAG TPA: ABC transporter permease [Chloroflexota bacterium]|nr:ABC transporter permease [Chloroflexota bacterium]